MTLLQKAIRLAAEVHKNQTRRDGVTPYIVHPYEVATLLRMEGAEEKVQAVAWLHDILEDTDDKPGTLERLKEEFPDEIVEAVQTLTHTKESYSAYLIKVRRNPLAKRVKMADMEANLNDDPTPLQVVRYTEGRKFLHDELATDCDRA